MPTENFTEAFASCVLEQSLPVPEHHSLIPVMDNFY